MSSIGNTLRRIFGPSLMRRLVFSQVLLTAILWVCALFWLSNLLKEERVEDDLLTARKGAEIAFELAANGHFSDLQYASIVKRFDEFQQPSFGVETSNNTDTSYTNPKVYVHREGRLVYASPGAPAEPKVQVQNEIVVVTVGTEKMNYFQQTDVETQTRFSVLTLNSGAISFAPWSKSILFAPLILVLPFILLPAMFSIWLALKPLRKLSREVAMKGPRDLTSLKFSPRQRELKPLAEAINQLLEKLRMSSDRERRFVADAAHELRTPLASIQVLSQTLAARRGVNQDSELIESLLRSSDRASRLVVQLLALMRSDVETIEVPLRSIDLAAVLQERLADFSPAARKKNIDLELELGENINAQIDAELEGLTSLIDNLIGNAIKYGPIGSKVQVLLQRSSDGAWLLTVQDFGNGIPAEYRHRVFDRFFRAPDQNQSGSGLGLAIVKSVADRLNATVSLESGEFGGLLVVVKFQPLSDRTTVQ
jgi:signal transduction histidine kinase